MRTEPIYAFVCRCLCVHSRFIGRQWCANLIFLFALFDSLKVRSVDTLPPSLKYNHDQSFSPLLSFFFSMSILHLIKWFCIFKFFVVVVTIWFETKINQQQERTHVGNWKRRPKVPKGQCANDSAKPTSEFEIIVESSRQTYLSLVFFLLKRSKKKDLKVVPLRMKI